MTREEQARAEIRKLLLFVYFEWSKAITAELETFWLENLRGVKPALCWKAARLLVREKSFGEPKFQDFWACLKRVAPRCRPAYNPHRPAEEEAFVGLPRIHDIIRGCIDRLPAVPKPKTIDYQGGK
jgi:hypothetical protein